MELHALPAALLNTCFGDRHTACSHAPHLLTTHRPRSDAEHGERAGDPRPRYAEAQAGGWVDYVRLDAPQGVYAALNKLWAQEPALLKGAPLVVGLVGKWTFERLVRVGGACEGRSSDVSLCCRRLLPALTTPSCFLACRRRRWGRGRSCACCAPTRGATGSSRRTPPRTCMEGAGGAEQGQG